MRVPVNPVPENAQRISTTTSQEPIHMDITQELEGIRADVARIDELNATELDALKARLGDCFDEVDGQETTPETVVIIQELAQGIEATMARSAAIDEAQAQAESDKETARQVRASLDGKVDDSGEDDEKNKSVVRDADEDADENADNKELV